MVDLKPDQIDSFAAELRHESYADAALIREAFATGRSANVSQIDSVWKFDLFPLRNDAYSRTELGRRTMRAIRPDGREGKQSEAKRSNVHWPRWKTRSCASWNGIAPELRRPSGSGTTFAA